MPFQTSRYTVAKVFREGFFCSWSARGALVMNLLLCVGLAAMLWRRWDSFPPYLLLIAAGLVLGSFFTWAKAWKEHQWIGSALALQHAESAERSAQREEAILRGAAALLHLTTFHWVMGAFFAALAIDQATR